MVTSVEFWHHSPAEKDDPVLDVAQYARSDEANAKGEVRRAKTETTTETLMMGVLEQSGFFLSQSDHLFLISVSPLR